MMLRNLGGGARHSKGYSTNKTNSVGSLRMCSCSDPVVVLGTIRATQPGLQATPGVVHGPVRYQTSNLSYLPRSLFCLVFLFPNHLFFPFPLLVHEGLEHAFYLQYLRAWHIIGVVCAE